MQTNVRIPNPHAREGIICTASRNALCGLLTSEIPEENGRTKLPHAFENELWRSLILNVIFISKVFLLMKSYSFLLFSHRGPEMF